jgi:alkanesulfonate monooxygenase SsuD/methylene tetrahydromethanopterin reductase-like flavin-dependent oxidoreductase (luciferase family)
MKTERIKMGTAITPTWPRHPLSVVQQVVALHSLMPGRLRLGVGPSHRPGIYKLFGIRFERPFEHLREYVTILKKALQEGPFDLEGSRFNVHGRVAEPPNVPVMISALRPGAWRLAGEIADGGLAWISPLPYLRDRALPALKEGAAAAGRAKPLMVAHCFVAVSEDADGVRQAGADRLAVYPRLPFYQEMFAEAGFPEAREGKMSEGMFDAVVVHGNEDTVRRRLQEYLDAGMDEVIASVLVVGDDRRASTERTLRVLVAL